MRGSFQTAAGSPLPRALLRPLYVPCATAQGVAGVRELTGREAGREQLLGQPLPAPHKDCYARGAAPQGPARLSSPYRALVKATLSRLGSFKNPMPWCSLARTQERMIKSFSRPWNASTLAISTSYRGNNHGQPTGFLQGALSPHKLCQDPPWDPTGAPGTRSCRAPGSGRGLPAALQPGGAGASGRT